MPRACANPMDFFAVRLPLANRHPMITPGQSHLLAFSNVPAQMTLATGDLDAFVLDQVPLTIKQPVALTMVSSLISSMYWPNRRSFFRARALGLGTKHS